MFSSLAILLALSASVVAQSSPAVVCVAGQCLEGFSNTTIGAILSAPGAATDILLLPGQYTTTTNPALLHNLLTSSSASLSPSVGFGNSTSSPSLPLNLDLQPGIAVYSQSLYAGQAGFSALPTTPIANASTPLTANSIALSSNVFVAVNAGSNDRIILWDAVPDVAQLPTTSSGSLSLLDIQSSSCSPPCSGSGVCLASGTCSCPTGFTGSSCESCASGFFGSTCQACPTGCSSCDEGISGTGRCLVPIVTNAPSTCNCLNGVCGSNGQCTCNTGWTTADNGTACAKCSTGFFLSSTGNCQVCELGCTECADGTGNCVTCKTGFSQDANDSTKCNPPVSTTSSGTICPDGSFGNGTACTACSPTCSTCTAGTSNDCIVCASGHYSLNGSCVSTDANGVCEGSTDTIADNNKHECDSCGAKCTSCKIPNFSIASTVDQLQCTGCLPGFFLSDGQCVESCPSNAFVSPQDNLTCTTCDSSCSTCSGSSTFCLTCPNNQLASGGKCVSNCPSNTFSSSGSCIACHPDCASCSGSSFNQCSSCNSDRPVLTNGRCLPTCSQTQFFDKTSSSCQTCDSSCSSCSGSGPNNCLACSSSTQVLRAGSCVAANCNGSSNVIPGLGVCLSDLVVVPQASGTSSASPLPSITGISSPTVVTTTKRNPLAWWEILLMALGCAFIFLVVLMLWRRRARKQRAKRTAMFAKAKALDKKTSWRWKLVRFGEKLFGHNASRRVPVHNEESEEIKLMKLRDAEEARHNLEIDKLIKSYEYSRAGSRSSRAPSRLPSLYDHPHHPHNHTDDHLLDDSRSMSADSLYSQITGLPRRTANTRQPVRTEVLTSRFSSTTLGSSIHAHKIKRPPPPPMPTDAEAYAMSIRPGLTGSSKNPFRQ